MKSLAEIQLELRNMVNQIEALNSEIENLKPKDAAEIEFEYVKIDRLANKHPIHNSQLSQQSDLVKKLYFQFLAFIADKDNSSFNEQLLFIKRIAVGTYYNKGTMEIIKDGMDLDERFFGDIAENLSDMKESLILDALIEANIAGIADEDKLKAIADAAIILGCGIEALIILSKLASSIIQDNINIFYGITCTSSHKWYGKFSHYIPKDWIIKSRVSCGEYSEPVSSTSSSSDSMAGWFLTIQKMVQVEIRKRVDAGALVKRGETIVEYKQMNTVKTIVAPKDGMVFFADIKRKSQSGTDENIVKVYLVSCFDEYNDFCSWLKITSN